MLTARSLTKLVAAKCGHQVPRKLLPILFTISSSTAGWLSAQPVNKGTYSFWPFLGAGPGNVQIHFGPFWGQGWKVFQLRLLGFILGVSKGLGRKVLKLRLLELTLATSEAKAGNA